MRRPGAGSEQNDTGGAPRETIRSAGAAAFLGAPDSSLTDTLIWSPMDDRGGWAPLFAQAAEGELSQGGRSRAETIAPQETAEWTVEDMESYEGAGAGAEPGLGAAGNRGGAGQSAQASAGPSVARSSFIMGLGTLASRILGLVRSPILLAPVVGTLLSPAADSFDVANKLPNLIYMIVVGGLVNAVLVPAIVRATKESLDGGQAFINKLITIAIVFLGSVTAILTLAAPVIVRLFAGTMDSDWFELTASFAYWCMPQVFFYGLYVVLGQILNARESFGPYMWAPVLNNVIAIAGFLVILQVFGAADLAEGSDIASWTPTRVAMLGGFSTLGIVLQALVLVIPMHRLGLRYRPDFAWRGAGLSSAGKAAWWMFLTQLVSLLPTMMWSNVAAGVDKRARAAGIDRMEVAGNFAHTTAYTIYTIPQSLIVVSIATAIFTRLAKKAVDRNLDAVRADVSSTVRTVSTLMFLCTTGLIVLAVPITRLLAMTAPAEQAVTVAKVLIAMSLGIVPVGVQTIFNRVYYAFEDTRGNFFIVLPFQLALTALYWGCLQLPPQWAVVGVGLIQSFVNILMPFAMARHLSPKLGGIDGPALIVSHAKLAVVTLISMAAGAGVLRLFGPFTEPITVIGALIRLAVVGPVIVAAFLAAMKLLRMEELSMMMAPLRAIGRKLGIGR